MRARGAEGTTSYLVVMWSSGAVGEGGRKYRSLCLDALRNWGGKHEERGGSLLIVASFKRKAGTQMSSLPVFQLFAYLMVHVGLEAHLLPCFACFESGCILVHTWRAGVIADRFKSLKNIIRY